MKKIFSDGQIHLASTINREAQRKATAGRSFYAPFKRPGAKPAITDQFDVRENKYLYYCALLSEACLELNPAARKSFVEIINATKSEGMVAFRNETIAVTEYAQKNRNAEYLNPLKDLPEEYEDSLSKCIALVGPYIRHFFNHDQENLNIIPENIDSGYLTLAIALCALVEGKGTTFDEVNQGMLGDNYWVLQDDTDDINNRPDRRRRHRLAEMAKIAGWHIVKEAPLYELAKLWYVAYVINGNLATSLLGYYKIPGTDREISLPKIYHEATAWRNLHDFILATGYTKT